jgi:hypothetical protein
MIIRTAESGLQKYGRPLDTGGGGGANEDQSTASLCANAFF